MLELKRVIEDWDQVGGTCELLLVVVVVVEGVVVGAVVALV